MEKVLTNTKMVLNMLDNILMAINKVTVFYTMVMDLYHMKEISKMDCLMVKEKHIVKMEKLYKQPGFRESIINYLKSDFYSLINSFYFIFAYT